MVEGSRLLGHPKKPSSSLPGIDDRRYNVAENDGFRTLMERDETGLHTRTGPGRALNIIDIFLCRAAKGFYAPLKFPGSTWANSFPATRATKYVRCTNFLAAEPPLPTIPPALACLSFPRTPYITRSRDGCYFIQREAREPMERPCCLVILSTSSRTGPTKQIAPEPNASNVIHGRTNMIPVESAPIASARIRITVFRRYMDHAATCVFSPATWRATMPARRS